LIDKAHIAINGNNNVVNNTNNTNHITFPIADIEDSSNQHMSVMYVLTEQKLWLMDKPTASLDRIMNMVHCGV
jgi:hypothetical protein